MLSVSRLCNTRHLECSEEGPCLLTIEITHRSHRLVHSASGTLATGSHDSLFPTSLMGRCEEEDDQAIEESLQR